MSGHQAGAVRYDVLILGSSPGASALALVLARHGVRVAMITSDTHPRYRYGETQTAVTTWLFRTLAARYDIPELDRLAGFPAAHSGVSRQVGAATAQTFHARAESWAVHQPKADPAATLYRQDTDAYLFWAAVRHGARARQLARISDVGFEADRVTVTIAGGETFIGRFLVDAGGRESAAMATLDTNVRTDITRRPTWAAHTLLIAGKRDGRPLAPRRRAASGPAHHLGAGGYLTISPYGNNRNTADPVLGVRLTMNACSPGRRDDPEAEFQDWVRRLPTAAETLRHTAAVQPWFATAETQQYRRTLIHGDRWFAFGDTAGWTDPFLAAAMNRELRLVGALGWRLIDAVAAGESGLPRFGEVAALDERLWDEARQSDEMMLDALDNPSLYRPALRTRLLDDCYHVLSLRHVHRHLRLGDDKPARTLDEALAAGEHTGAGDLVAAAVAECRRAAEGDTEQEEARRRLESQWAEHPAVPPVPGFPEDRGRAPRRLLAWFRSGTPPQIRRLAGSLTDDFRDVLL